MQTYATHDTAGPLRPKKLRQASFGNQNGLQGRGKEIQRNSSPCSKTSWTPRRRAKLPYRNAGHISRPLPTEIVRVRRHHSGKISHCACANISPWHRRRHGNTRKRVQTLTYKSRQEGFFQLSFWRLSKVTSRSSSSSSRLVPGLRRSRIKNGGRGRNSQ